MTKNKNRKDATRAVAAGLDGDRRYLTARNLLATSQQPASVVPTPARTWQYAVSDDAHVLAVLAANMQARDVALERLATWVERYGTEEYVSASRGWGVGVAALSLPAQPPTWARGPRPGTYRPRKGSLEERGMLALRWEPATVPGLEREFKAGGPFDATCTIMWPVPFVVDGRAWAGMTKMPTTGEFGPQWQEALGSAYQAAMESWEAAQREVA